MKYRLRTPTLGFVVGLVIALGIISPSVRTQQVSAASAGDWRAGNIIDDGLFYNGNDMSAGEIQAFLNSKVPVCDTWGTKTSEFGGGTRAQYGASQGYPAPYTCLKDYSQSIPGYSADAYCGAIGAGAKSAAQIIKDVSQACGIGSRVLLVLLQKEQSLITDEWPWSNQYQKATGFACPDTAPCDSQYAGYFNQVYRAARQYKVYRANPNSYRYKARQNNAVQFNPNVGCGSSNVYIENDATAGLYIYTPYQPNQAALNNLYGSGDGCSAYGNRNFWRMYTDWFGSTRGPDYSWEWAGQFAYTNSSKTTTKNLTSMRMGEQAYVVVRARNSGRATWTNSGQNPVRLGTVNPTERSSTFSPFSAWLSPSRPAQLLESSVAPGEFGTFEFWLTANAPGSFGERFNLLAESRAWFNDIGLSFGVNVIPDIYSWSWNSQYAFTDETKTTPRNLVNLRVGERVYVGFTARNTGNTTWSNTGFHPVRVGTSAPNERRSVLSNTSGWLNDQRPVAMKENSVAPGGIATFEFWVTANSIGSFSERFNLLAEGKTWFNDLGLSYGLSVRPDNYSWSWNSQYAFTDETKTTPKNLLNLHAGEQAYIGVTARNTGNVPWTNTGQHPVRIGTAGPNERLSIFSTSSNWLSNRRPAALRESVVNPGALGTFEFWITANSSGTYNERFNILAEDQTWFNDIGLSYGIQVSQ